MQELGQKPTRVLHYLTAVCKDRESSTNCQVNGTATRLLGLKEGNPSVGAGWEDLCHWDVIHPCFQPPSNPPSLCCINWCSDWSFFYLKHSHHLLSYAETSHLAWP